MCLVGLWVCVGSLTWSDGCDDNFVCVYTFGTVNLTLNPVHNPNSQTYLLQHSSRCPQRNSKMLLSSRAAVAAMTMMMTTVVVVVRVRAGLWLFRTGIIYPSLYVRRQGTWKYNLSNIQYLMAASLVECMFVCWVGCG